MKLDFVCGYIDNDYHYDGILRRYCYMVKIDGHNVYRIFVDERTFDFHIYFESVEYIGRYKNGHEIYDESCDICDTTVYSWRELWSLISLTLQYCERTYGKTEIEYIDENW